MKIIARPECTGKTKELLQLSLDTNTPIWCLSESKKRSLEEKSMFYFGKMAEILCGIEINNSEAESILIDDVDKILYFLINEYTSHPTAVAGFTLTI